MLHWFNSISRKLQYRTTPITFLFRLMLIRHTDLLQWRACLCTHLLQGLLTKVNFVALNSVIVIVFNTVKTLLLSVIQKAGMRNACQMKEYVSKFFYTSCLYVCLFSRWQISTYFQNLFIIKATDALTSQIYFGSKLYMFRAVPLPETCRVLSQNKFGKLVHLLVLL